MQTPDLFRQPWRQKGGLPSTGEDIRDQTTTLQPVTLVVNFLEEWQVCFLGLWEPPVLPFDHWLPSLPGKDSFFYLCG